MLGIVFAVIVVISFIFAIFSGNLCNMSGAILDAAGKAVTTTLTLVGAMSLWSGVMETLREAGAIDALRDFQESVPDNGRASDDSVMLTVLSTAAFSFVPTTMLALRQAAGAKIMFELLPAVWINGIIGSLSAVILTKLLCKIDKRWRKRP